MFTGCGTALITPFRADLSLDEETFRSLVRKQIEAGINFLVPCGTTGESPTLSRSEYLRVVEITIEEAKGKVPVLAGAGGYNTEEVIELGNLIKKAGVDGILSVTPYYNKPTQEGLYQHYKHIAENVNLPVMLYNIQGRTAVNIEPDTVVRLSAIPNIIGVKEASANIGQMATLANKVPKDFIIVSGDDSTALPLIALGGQGLISVAANLIPGPMAELVNLALNNDFEGARAIQKQYLPFMDVNFIETSPGPLKAAMGLVGLIDPVLRLPMVPPRPENLEKIKTVLSNCGLMPKSRSNAVVEGRDLIGAK